MESNKSNVDPLEKRYYMPEPDDVAAYVESLKIYLKDGEISNVEVADIVKTMPAPAHIKTRMSVDEIKVLFESVRWAWKIITGQDLIDMSTVQKKAETLFGNYWMLNRGILLKGNNHFTIVKQNTNLFQSLLNIHAFALHQKLCGRPNELIKTIIDHGGCRVFITQDKRSYFQMNDKSYAEWGRAKVKNLDFKKKIVKLIDKSIDYDGWKSGITIIL
jgi:hypothetical protein